MAKISFSLFVVSCELFPTRNKDLLGASGVMTKCNCARFEVLTAVFWDVMLRWLVGLYIPEDFNELPST